MKANIGKRVAIASTIGILCTLLFSAYATSKTITSFNNIQQLKNRTCFIIDAGHGGVDGGALSCTGIEESNINLEIALRLNDLMHLLGMNTQMIRTEDISIHTKSDSIAAIKVSDLKERVKIANQTPNAILISIHQNYYADSRYRGSQVFYNNQGPDLAQKMQNAFVQTLNPGSKRKAKKADGIYLMQNTKCPAVLIECGFLSNPSEENLLRTPDYQKKLCCVISSVASCYIYNNYIA